MDAKIIPDSEQPLDQAHGLQTRFGAIAGTLGISAILLVVLFLILAAARLNGNFTPLRSLLLKPVYLAYLG
jgi:hypothetical protein